MVRVTATDFKNNIGTYSDAAMSEPVTITSHGRDRLVLMSAEEYQRLSGEGAADRPNMKDLIRKRAEAHRDTLVELAKR